MKCPKTFHAESVVGNQEQWVWEDCLKEECAWWLDETQMCSIRETALELRYIQFRLQDMVTGLKKP